jgi:hypothetical protein
MTHLQQEQLGRNARWAMQTSDVWLEDYIVVVPHAGETIISGER